MLNVPELEQQYKKRIYRRYAILIIIFITICIITIGIAYFKHYATNNKHTTMTTKPAVSIINTKLPLTNTKLIVKKITKQKKPSITPIKSYSTNKQLTVGKTAKEQNITVPSVVSKIQTNPQNLQILQPSMQFIDNIHSNANNDQYTKVSHVKKRIVSKATTVKHPLSNKTTATRHTSQIKTVTIPMIEQSSVIIKSVPISSNMQDIIKRFKRTNDPILGLFLARRYYHLKKYNLAYNYALLTNQLDSKNEQSWIIFAKSLVKLGQTNMAIQTLKSYIKISHSKNAKVLLENIQSGHFK